MAVLLGLFGGSPQGGFRPEIGMIYPERPPDNDDFAGRIVLSEKDAREAARLLRMLSEAVGIDLSAEESPDNPPSRESLVSRARIVLHSRRARYRHFKRNMFGEPAWDILLVLYITETSRERQTIGRLADWIDTPLSTVVRWVGYLENDGFVARKSHPTDKRTMFIQLLDKGRQAMDNYLCEMAWRPVTGSDATSAP